MIRPSADTDFWETVMSDSIKVFYILASLSASLIRDLTIKSHDPQ